MMREDVKNKEKIAKKILDFFLKLESKLTGKSSQ